MQRGSFYPSVSRLCCYGFLDDGLFKDLIKPFSDGLSWSSLSASGEKATRMTHEQLQGHKKVKQHVQVGRGILLYKVITVTWEKYRFVVKYVILASCY